MAGMARRAVVARNGSLIQQRWGQGRMAQWQGRSAGD